MWEGRVAADDVAMTVQVPRLDLERRAALVVATARYEDQELAQLRSPVRDAHDLAAVLADPEIGGFTVTTVADQPEAQLRRQIAAFLAQRTAEQTVLVFLSCHGLQDRSGRLYFAASDTLKSQPRATALSSAHLLEELDDCRARQQILILDCCFSGAFDERHKGTVDLERHLAGHGRGRAVLTASRGFEYSYEGQSLGAEPAGSMFTTGLVHGLQTGAADADQDGYVSWDEAFAYADEHVRTAGAAQTPQRYEFGGEGHKIILARSPKGRPVTPAPLPEHLRDSLNSGSEHIRAGAVHALAEWLGSPDLARSLAATQVLRDIADHDNPRVAAVARQQLTHRPVRGTAAPDSPAPQTSARLRPSEAVLNGHFGSVVDIAFSPDGHLLATASDDHTARVWDPATGQPLHILTGHARLLRRVVFSPDSALIATGSFDGTARIWDPSTGQCLRTLKSGHVSGIAFSPDGKLLAIAIMTGGAGVWDPVTGRRLHRLRCRTLMEDPPSVTGIAFSPDGKLLATANYEGTIRIWDPTTGRRLDILKGRGDLERIAFSPDGKLLATANYTGGARIWDLATGRLLHALTGHTRAVRTVAFSPDGKLLATAGRDHTALIWESSTGQRLHTLTGHTDAVRAVAFSPDGELLATASADGTARIWEPAADLGASAALAGHIASVNCIAFSPDGTILATGSDDETARLWACQDHHCP